MAEPIEIAHYPVWEQQPDEPAEIFNLFTAYFLPLPRANLVAAYRQFLSNSGNDRQDVGNASSQWREYCDKYQWRLRHASYWRYRNHSDQRWREEQLRQHQAENLDTARLLRDKAREILVNFDIDNASPKDAAALLRLAGELVEKGLDVRDIDKAVSACVRWGFEVSLPSTDGKIEHSRT